MNGDDGFLYPAFERFLGRAARCMSLTYHSRSIEAKDTGLVVALVLEGALLFAATVGRESGTAMALAGFFAFHRITSLVLQFAHALFVGYETRESVELRRRAPFVVGVHFLELILLFGVLYAGLPAVFGSAAEFGPRIGGVGEALYVSAATATTIGAGDIQPAGGLARFLAASQALFTVLVVAALLGALRSKMED